MASFFLKLVGFNEPDRNSIEAIVSLANSRLAASLIVTNAVHADFYLFANAPNHLDQKTAFPKERSIFLVPQDVIVDGHFLSTDKHRIPSLTAFIKLFNKLVSAADDMPVETPAESKLFAQASPEAPLPANVSAEEPPVSNYFDKTQGALGLLLSIPNIGLVKLVNPNGVAIVLGINQPAKLFYSSANYQQIKIHLADTLTIETRPCGDEVLTGWATKHQLTPQSWQTLLWRVAFDSSQGKHPVDYQNQPIHLMRWPELNDLPQLQRLAAFMLANTVDLATVAEHTQTSLDVVYGFYNACHLFGWMQQAEQFYLHPKKQTIEQQQLLGSIGRRLRKIKDS